MPNDEPKNNPTGFNLPAEEEKILKFWDERNIFGKTLAKGKGKKTFVFYEGPPTANGRPGVHHVLTRAFKDLIPRYKTMRGFFVPRKGGWDTHGLPVEITVEKQLGLKSKKEIEKYGIAAFNQKCKESVWEFKEEWERMTKRMGFWLDLKNPYITYETDYIESLWWIIAQVAKKKLLYKGHRVVPWCTRCGTALSSHELAQGYKEVVDSSVYVKFKLKSGQKIGKDFTADDKTYILSWTTTPWTLPGNVALAVGEKIKYDVASFGKSGGKKEIFMFATDLHDKVRDKLLGTIPASEAPVLEFKTQSQASGKDLVGLAYEPLFHISKLQTPTAYKVYPADFVTTTDGTGVVHIAPMYGEDDYQLGKKMGLPQHHTVDEDGRFTHDVPSLAGMLVKSKDGPVTKETEEKIFEHLKKHGNFLRTEEYKHEYPHCWRCDTPILYYARDSWFIGMSKLRSKLLAANKKINWTPEHIKEGRFGGWLAEAKDWNFSRERYWGTPLPVWECKKCATHETIGSVDELSARAGGPKNNYWVMRHGESLSNVMGIIDSGQARLHLTAKGRKQAEASARKLKSELDRKKVKIDMIFSSDITRTRETEKIAAAVLAVRDVIFDKRLEEIHLGPALTGCHDGRYAVMFPSYESRFEQRPEGGESLRDLRARLWQFLDETEKAHKGKNILIVSHEYPIWMLLAASNGWSEKQAIAEKMRRGDDFFGLAQLEKLNVRVAPRNAAGEIDLHKPYIDEVMFPCKSCGGEMVRVKEVADVWFDSGSMPFAQQHYPFENKAAIDKKFLFPARYISEAIDQTRGWFYTLLSVSTLLGRGAPYQNVICLGHVNDKNGQKMSKSKGNIVSPWEMMEKYGADAVRWYFYTVNPPGEPKNFNELEVAKSYRKMHLIVYNSLAFWKTYANKNLKLKTKNLKQKNVLDAWILARLNQLIEGATAHLDKYRIREAALLIEEFVDDLSRWYIRRSRRRLQKPISERDFKAASGTLGFVLGETVKLLAPFTPFFAEALYGELGGRLESVHLEAWPTVNLKLETKNLKLIEAMREARRLASLGLAKRAEKGIKVRQPLGKLKIKNQKLKINKELLAILADEVNVKEIVFDKQLQNDIELDTTITPELREEGILRDLVRSVQELRQEARLEPKDRIVLMVALPGLFHEAAERNEKLLKAEVGAKEIEYKKSEKFQAEATIKIEGQDAWIGLRKI